MRISRAIELTAMRLQAFRHILYAAARNRGRLEFSEAGL
jgi:hypothetical protein